MPRRPYDRRTHPRLPNQPERRRVPRLVEEPDDLQPTPSQRTDRQLDDAILHALRGDDGELVSLAKWELRQMLHENEYRIVRRLQQLRDAGLVKVIGRKTDKRRWALKEFKVHEPSLPPGGEGEKSLPPRYGELAPKTSWWLDLGREDFQKKLEEERIRMSYAGRKPI